MDTRKNKGCSSFTCGWCLGIAGSIVLLAGIFLSLLSLLIPPEDRHDYLSALPVILVPILVIGILALIFSVYLIKTGRINNQSKTEILSDTVIRNASSENQKIQEENLESDINYWQCKHCGTMNHNTNELCNKCLRLSDKAINKRKETQERLEKDINYWRCGHCGTMNHNTSQACRSCLKFSDKAIREYQERMAQNQCSKCGSTSEVYTCLKCPEGKNKYCVSCIKYGYDSSGSPDSIYCPENHWIDYYDLSNL